jgi:arylsulfatase A-like enzyme
MLRDQQATNPSKPWYMSFCPGANHAPHHSPREFADKYKGMFDEGYEAYRDWVLARMIAKGVLPAGTTLNPINPLPDDVAQPIDAMRPWDSLNDDEKRLFARMAEVYAGFSEYTDAQVGRIVDYLEQTGQLDNTIIFYCADNGASGEGSPSGSVNENKFFNSIPTNCPRTSSISTRWAGRTPTTTIPPAGPSPFRRHFRCSSGIRNIPAEHVTRW